MNKGGIKKPEPVKPVEGKKDMAKPAGGQVYFGTTPGGRKGKKA